MEQESARTLTTRSSATSSSFDGYSYRVVRQTSQQKHRRHGSLGDDQPALQRSDNEWEVGPAFNPAVETFHPKDIVMMERYKSIRQLHAQGSFVDFLDGREFFHRDNNVFRDSSSSKRSDVLSEDASVGRIEQLFQQLNTTLNGSDKMETTAKRASSKGLLFHKGHYRCTGDSPLEKPASPNPTEEQNHQRTAPLTPYTGSSAEEPAVRQNERERKTRREERERKCKKEKDKEQRSVTPPPVIDVSDQVTVVSTIGGTSPSHYARAARASNLAIPSERCLPCPPLLYERPATTARAASRKKGVAPSSKRKPSTKSSKKLTDVLKPNTPSFHSQTSEPFKCPKTARNSSLRPKATRDTATPPTTSRRTTKPLNLAKVDVGGLMIDVSDPTVISELGASVAGHHFKARGVPSPELCSRDQASHILRLHRLN